MHNGEFHHPRLAQIYEALNGMTAAEMFFLDLAGFDVEAIYGGWQKEAIGMGSGELIVVARARQCVTCSGDGVAT